jgi:hypothetical protein
VALRWLGFCVLIGCGRFNFDPYGTADGGDGPGTSGVRVLSGQQAYVKASNTGAGDQFGSAIALSADGSTMAIGAYGEASTATGINGDQTNNNAQYAGAVYVFTRSGTTWAQQAYIKAANAQGDDGFGAAIALSSDGSVLAVGAPKEASNAVGIDGNASNNSSSGAGAVYVFTRSGAVWTQSVYVKASNTDGSDTFGGAIALSGNGTTLAVGATGEASNATGLNGNQADNSALRSGAVYVFVHAASWFQQAYIKASNAEAGDYFGSAIALSDDGSELAVGASAEASSAAGVDGNQADNGAPGAGAIYLFGRVGVTWTQRAYLKASNPDRYDGFGSSVALSGDGQTLAVGAPWEASRSTGIGGDPTDNAAGYAGAVYLFSFDAAWTQSAYVKASNTGSSDVFGWAVALNTDATRLVVGALGESSDATGLDGDQANDLATEAGAAYCFARSSTTGWSQAHYIKPSSSDIYLDFGSKLALSRDGRTLAIGAPLERSSATGIDGDQHSGSTSAAGAVYVFQ